MKVFRFFPRRQWPGWAVFCLFLAASLARGQEGKKNSYEFTGTGNSSGPYTEACGWKTLGVNLNPDTEPPARPSYGLGFIGRDGDTFSGTKSMVARWEAPKGEVITAVTFDLVETNGSDEWTNVVCRGDSEDLLSNQVLWKASPAKGTSTANKLEFSASDGIRAIDFGFQTQAIYRGWKSIFGNIVITTVPNPK